MYSKKIGMYDLKLDVGIKYFYPKDVGKKHIVIKFYRLKETDGFLSRTQTTGVLKVSYLYNFFVTGALLVMLNQKPIYLPSTPLV